MGKGLLVVHSPGFLGERAPLSFVKDNVFSQRIFIFLPLSSLDIAKSLGAGQ